MSISDRIVLDPSVMGGRLCVQGTRVTVRVIVGLLPSDSPTHLF